ncbi:FGGY family carbohydrate kinase [Streptomyces sp. NBC_00076]|uniref:FGGY family carbohydrate kinase n=1 Tax=Streptomyces sp. NBC_00076 TaxID=2975642 RepID=UPI00386EF813
MTGGAVPLLRWLKDNDPSLHQRARWVLAPKDFLVLRLSGQIATDMTSAAYTLGSDVTRRAWDPALLAAGGKGPECFPPPATRRDGHRRCGHPGRRRHDGSPARPAGGRGRP